MERTKTLKQVRIFCGNPQEVEKEICVFYLNEDPTVIEKQIKITEIGGAPFVLIYFEYEKILVE